MADSAHPVPRWIAAVLWAAGAFGLFALIGFVILPPVIQSVMTKQLSERLHRPVSIREVLVNPFTWSLQISGVVIREPRSDERFVSFERLHLNFDALSLIRLGPVVSEATLDGLFVSVVRRDDLTYNLSDLLEASDRGPHDPDASPLRFSINNIRVTGGGIDFDDRPKHVRHTVRDIEISVPFVSNMPKAIDIFVTPAFSATVNGTPVAFQGQTKPFNESLATEVTIMVADVNIPSYLEYLPGPLTFALPSAALDGTLTVSFRQYADRNPALVLQGTVVLKQVVVNTLDDRLVSRIPRLVVNVDAADVFNRTATVQSIALERPEFHARRNRSGIINLTTLGAAGPPESGDSRSEAPTTTAPPGPRGNAPFRVMVEAFKMSDATVTWTDATTQPPFAATLAPVTMTVSHLTNEPGKPADVMLTLSTDAGEAVTHQGALILEPLSANGRVTVRGAPIKRYAAYYRHKVPVSVEGGTVNAAVQYRYQANDKHSVKTVSDGSVVITGLRVKRPGTVEDFLKVPQLSVTGTQIDLVHHAIQVGEVATHQGMVLVERAGDGTIDLLQLADPTGGTRPNGEAPPSARRPPSARDAPQPWTLQVKKLRLDQYAMTVIDRVPKSPALFTLKPLNLVVSRFSTAKDSQAEVSADLTVNAAGRLVVRGTAGIAPIAATLRVDLHELPLVPFQPYVSEKMRVTIAGGQAATEGILTVTAQGTDQPVIRYRGNAQLSQAALRDHPNGEELLKLHQVAVTDLQAVTRPSEVRAQEVALDNPDVRVAVNENGKTNMAALFIESEPQSEPHALVQGRGRVRLVSVRAPAVTEAPAAPGPIISVERVTVRNGRVGFTDRSLSPHYATALTDIRMTLTGLTSEPGHPATGQLQARVNDTSPVNVEGTVDALAGAFFADVGVHVKGIELSPLGPYAGKYVGYLIKKGQVSMDLTYLIEGGTIQSSNQVLVKQLAFGEETNSPDATTLPVKLAVSLLRDRSGDIKLDIPVTGSLDDPSFSVGGVILGVIKNMLVKAATSPFSLLSAAVGSEEELSHIDFSPGNAALTPAARTRLTTLATLLHDRPGVKLDIVGRVDPGRDREALKQLFYERKLKAQKLADLARQGRTPQSVDAVTIEPAERSRYLKEAYKQEDMPGKPTYVFGILKSIPDADMERMLLGAITITADDLRQLAQQRGAAVKEFLVNEKQIEAERAYLVDGEAHPTGDEKGGPETRVVLAIHQ